MSTSSRLYNEDLKPAAYRTWGAYSIVAVWFAAVHNIGVYAAAAGMFLIGLSVWQVLIGLIAGYVLAYVSAQLIGNVGQRHGLPFPVLARVSFGIYGANVAALIRGAIAIAWYGIQTFLASQAVMVLLLVVAPGLADLTSGAFLGLSPLSWACFLGLWALQMVVVTHGMELIRWVQNWAGAIVSLLMGTLAVMLMIKCDGHFDFSLGTHAGPHNAFAGVVGVAFSTFTIYATLMLNLCDFTRFAVSAKAVRRGNLWGLPVNGAVFSATVAAITVAGYSLYGRVITEPTEILQQSQNKWLIAVGAALFVLATLGVNVVANLVSPAYDFANVFPKHITFTRGALIACVLAVVVMPWKLYSSPVAVTYFLGAMGALLGPVFGIIMVDYYLERRRHVLIDDLYSDSSDGVYYYRRGVNPRALISLLVSACISVPLAVVPAWHTFSPLAWFLGAAVAGLLYHVLSEQLPVTDHGADPADAELASKTTARAGVGHANR
jgi:NCS1 family nucleobase:cation symporter-1